MFLLRGKGYDIKLIDSYVSDATAVLEFKQEEQAIRLFHEDFVFFLRDILILLRES